MCQAFHASLPLYFLYLFAARMTLPAIGFVGLVFLFLLLIGGILLLLLLTKHEWRHRLCEALASYRNPAKSEKPHKLHRRKKKKKQSHDAYTPQPIPGPTQLLQQAEEDLNEIDQTDGHVTRQGRSSSFSKTQRSNSLSRNQRSNSMSKLRDNVRTGNKPPSTSPAYVNNPEQQFSYPGSPLKSSVLTGSKDLLGVPYYPTSAPTSVSSGTSTPQDYSEKKGILKKSSTSGYRNSGYSNKHKSVGYEDEVQEIV